MDSYTLDIAGLRRELPLFLVGNNIRIALFNLLGDVELTEHCAQQLQEKIQSVAYEVIVCPEAKAIPLAYALALQTKTPYVVLRKTLKPYMGKALSASTQSITTQTLQNLYLDEKDVALLNKNKVLLLDDVISTGSTLAAMRKILQQVNAQEVAVAAALTEGEEGREEIIALGNLPILR